MGGGNMAEAIIAGLVRHGYDSQHLFVMDRNLNKCEQLIKKYQVHADTAYPNHKITLDMIMLATKPQDAKAACALISQKISEETPLILSVMAGITTTLLSQWLNKDLAIIRAMPNTPALIQAGATGLFANTQTLPIQKAYAQTLMSAVGQVAWLTEEAHLDMVTALSGSGPAYYFYLMECMQKAAVAMGIPANVARLLTLQTAYGAAKLAMESDESFEALRAKVTSKGGTTAAALDVLMQHQLGDIFAAAMKAAQQKSVELSQLAARL